MEAIIHNVAAVAAYTITTLVFLYMTRFFRKKYITLKKTGFRNNFLLGYALMFFALFLYLLGLTILDIYEVLDDSFKMSDLQDAFPRDNGIVLSGFVEFVQNFYRPIFVVGLIAILYLFAFQVYPLEMMIGWEKKPGTKIMLIIGGLMLLIFIPPLQYTVYTAIIIYACFAGCAYGLFMNIFVNIKMVRTTTGVIKRRSMMIIIASLLFYLGFIWSLKVGWSRAISPALSSYDWDVVFGLSLVIFASFLYRTGLTGEISN